MQSEYALKVGTTLQGGKYMIVKVLGQNDFAIKYLAEDVDCDGLVIVKEFFMQNYCVREGTEMRVNGMLVNNEKEKGHLQEWNLKELKGLFLSGAKNLVSLEHPGIASVRDFFEENNTGYYVLDYVNGVALNTILDRYGLRDEVALQYTLNIIDALEYLHSKGIHYWDVRPANITIGRGDIVLWDRLVLTDFGEFELYNYLCCFGVSYDRTKGDIMVPPELGDSDFLGGVGFSLQTEIFSLGVAMYAMVMGAVPNMSAILNLHHDDWCVSNRWRKVLSNCLTLIEKNRAKSLMKVRMLLLNVVELNGLDQKKMYSKFEYREDWFLFLFFTVLFAMLSFLYSYMLVPDIADMLDYRFIAILELLFYVMLPLSPFCGDLVLCAVKRDMKKMKLGIEIPKWKDYAFCMVFGILTVIVICIWIFCILYPVIVKVINYLF